MSVIYSVNRQNENFDEQRPKHRVHSVLVRLEKERMHNYFYRFEKAPYSIVRLL
jgi:hypothetical protein